MRDEFERNYMAISEGEDEGDKVDDAPGATNADNVSLNVLSLI